jgi:hypothetical protein
VTPERADEEEVRAALSAAGIREDDLGFFARDIPEAGIRAPRLDFEAAGPVLVDWLTRVRTALVKERIVRSLPYLERARGSLEWQAAHGKTPLTRRQANAALARLT